MQDYNTIIGAIQMRLNGCQTRSVMDRLYFVKCFSQKSERKIPNFRNGIFPYISRKHFHMIVVQSVA